MNHNLMNAEGWISEVEYKVVEITVTGNNKETELKKKKTEERQRDIWDNIKYTNIGIIGARMERERKRARENIWRDYKCKFPIYGKGNTHSSGRNTENSIVNKSQKKYSKTHTNQSDWNSSLCSAEINLTSIHEDAGSIPGLGLEQDKNQSDYHPWGRRPIPGLAHWVKDLALSSAVVTWQTWLGCHIAVAVA